MTKDNKLELLSVGSKVKIGNEVIGTITGFNVRANNYVTYEVTWLNGPSSFETKEFEESFVESFDKVVKTKIGFINDNQD